MTEQEIFDTVARHLLTQNAKSLLFPDPGLEQDGTMCAYRAPTGLRCAVGCLIPDELYDATMETCTVHALITNFAAVGERFSEHEDLLAALQSVHDNTEVEFWKMDLASVAEDFHLNTEVLK